MSYTRLSKRPLLFRSFTGLEISEFNEIYTEIESRYNEHERKRLSRTKRERKVGAGRPFKLKEVRERKILDAFSLLQTVHYIHAFRISIRS
jgi:hypothetical protein